MNDKLWKRNWVAIIGYVIMLLLFALYRVDFHTTYAHLNIFNDAIGVDSVKGSAKLWFNWGSFKWYLVVPALAVVALLFERFAVAGVPNRDGSVRRNWISIIALIVMAGVIVYYYYEVNVAYCAVTEVHGRFVESQEALVDFHFNFRDFPWYNWAIIALFPLIWEVWYCRK